jgi:hypothetical protein
MSQQRAYCVQSPGSSSQIEQTVTRSAAPSRPACPVCIDSNRLEILKRAGDQRGSEWWWPAQRNPTSSFPELVSKDATARHSSIPPNHTSGEVQQTVQYHVHTRGGGHATPVQTGSLAVYRMYITSHACALDCLQRPPVQPSHKWLAKLRVCSHAQTYCNLRFFVAQHKKRLRLHKGVEPPRHTGN